MRLTLSLSLATLAVLACACPTNNGSDGGTGGSHTKTSSKGSSSSSSSGSGSIGANCNAQEPCQSGLTCLPQIQFGYCTEACDPSNPTTCPTGSACIEALPDQFACALSCTVAAGCARNGLSCDPSCLVCIPTVTVGNISCSPNFAGGGGRKADGGACGSAPTAAGSLTWGASVDTSESAATAAEYEGAGAAVVSDAGLVLVAYMETDDAGPTAQIGVSVSNDDGKTFMVEPPQAGNPLPGGPDSVSYDPSVAVDPFGLIYLSWGGAYAAPGNVPQGHLWVTSSQDGVTWAPPKSILGPGDIATVGNGGGGVDKPVVAVSPASGSLPYVVMGTFNGTYGGHGPYQIRLIVSSRQFDPYGVSVEVDDSAAAGRLAFRDLPSIAFDGAGTAYVVWAETSPSTDALAQIAEDQVFGTSIVGLTTASIWISRVPSVSGASVPGTNYQVSAPGESVVLDVPKIAAKPDGSQIYVAYTTSTGTPNVTNIEVASSLGSDGSGWNPPVVINQGLSDGANCSTNYHPALYLDPSGSLWVSWESNIDGAASVFYSVATVPQSLNFSPPAQLSDQPFLFNTYINIPSSLGGYQALFGANGEIFSLWSGAPNEPGPFPPSHVFLQKSTLP